MPRPCKKRRVCGLPVSDAFGPLNETTHHEPITMTVEEFETIRLIDVEGFTQEECAKAMNVARTTVQAIYASARKKVGACLVNKTAIHITGGNYQLCSGNSNCCKRKGCCKKNIQRED